MSCGHVFCGALSKQEQATGVEDQPPLKEDGISCHVASTSRILGLLQAAASPARVKAPPAFLDVEPGAANIAAAAKDILCFSLVVS